MKTALVHDWLMSPIGGSENCLQEIYSLYPSPIYTLLWNKEAFAETPFSQALVITSMIARLPWAAKKFRSYLPLFPLAIEQFNLKDHDLILSSSHCVAKGVLAHPDQLHICYCYSPMRYAWDLSHDYLAEAGLQRGIKGFCSRWLLHYLRGWDVHSSSRVDHFIAISQFIARRIRRAYGREAHVIYPPVDIDYFELETHKEDYYVAASRLVSYKKINLVIDAFANMADKKLVVVGDGPEMRALCSRATKNIEIMGYQSKSVLRDVLMRAKAMVFPALEDFDILPIESMACGTPVIAYRRGGCAETIINQVTGIFFEEQTADAICRAVQHFEQCQFDPVQIRRYALPFHAARFRKEFQEYVEKKTAEFRNTLH